MYLLRNTIELFNRTTSSSFRYCFSLSVTHLLLNSRSLAQKSSLDHSLTLPADPSKHKKMFPPRNGAQPEVTNFTGNRKKHAANTAAKSFITNPILFGGPGARQALCRKPVPTSKPSLELLMQNNKRQLQFLSDLYKGRKPVPGTGITSSKIVGMIGDDFATERIIFREWKI